MTGDERVDEALRRLRVESEVLCGEFDGQRCHDGKIRLAL